ncbi:MAG: hypothetical protein R3E91_01180 [Chlamydiales bacterium]
MSSNPVTQLSFYLKDSYLVPSSCLEESRLEDEQALEIEKQKITKLVLATLHENRKLQKELIEDRNSDLESLIALNLIDQLVSPPLFFPYYHRGVGAAVRGQNDCEATLLIFAIMILFSIFSFSIYATIKQGRAICKTRKEIREINTICLNTKCEKIKKICHLLILQKSQSLKDKTVATTFTSIIIPASVFLMVSAILALTSLYYRSPLNSAAVPLAIAGGAFSFCSLSGHLVRLVIFKSQERQRIQTLTEIYQKTVQLKALHPYSILSSLNASKAILEIEYKIYVKNGHHFSTAPASSHLPEYQKYSLSPPAC